MFSQYIERFDNKFDRSEVLFALQKDFDYASKVLDSFDHNMTSLTQDDIFKLTENNINIETIKSIENINKRNNELRNSTLIEHNPCRVCKNTKYRKLERNEHLGADEIGSFYLICSNCSTKIKI